MVTYAEADGNLEDNNNNNNKPKDKKKDERVVREQKLEDKQNVENVVEPPKELIVPMLNMKKQILGLINSMNDDLARMEMREVLDSEIGAGHKKRRDWIANEFMRINEIMSKYPTSQESKIEND